MIRRLVARGLLSVVLAAALFSLFRLPAGAATVYQEITGMEELNNNYKLVVNIGIPLVVSVTKRSVKELDFKLGDTVYCVFKSMSVAVV